MTSAIPNQEVAAAIAMAGIHLPPLSKIGFLDVGNKKRPRSLSSLSCGSLGSNSCNGKPFSLPFKKRRFFVDWDELLEANHQVKKNNTGVVTIASMDTTTASSSVSVSSVSLSPIPEQQQQQQEDNRHEKESNKNQQQQHLASPVQLLLHTRGRPSSTDRAETPLNNKNTKERSSVSHCVTPILHRTTTTTTNVTNKPKRLYHPKLESPLPNGCHGRTSRTQSYCRRGPNYKGSHYCRLHYFDPRYHSIILKESSGNSSSNNNNNDGDGEHVVEEPTRKTTDDSFVASPEEDDSSKRRHQGRQRRRPRDKLYRGPGTKKENNNDDDEVRCLAISTRGKRCCYVAISSKTQYCHRHSSLVVDDSSDKNNENTTQQQQDEPPPPRTPPPKRIRDGGDTDSSTIHNNNNNTLNLLSTDQWEGKTVRVSKGPYASRIGMVVKWRNGWVTLKLSEGGASTEIYHNRRSYELVLV